ncbi:hypothetical protein E2C01_064792 [Portunus trituberculatus]|uniref:Uncharacterized protein n=1 Tax=Portunus trituberculatus TaxID=210409 RepID=A0A5B7HH37_PORTR|nr:hypothetical protein [Portunus trituberculatus]
MIQYCVAYHFVVDRRLAMANSHRETTTVLPSLPRTGDTVLGLSMKDGMGQEVPSRESSEAVTNGCVERKRWRRCVGEARGGVGLSAASPAAEIIGRVWDIQGMKKRRVEISKHLLLVGKITYSLFGASLWVVSIMGVVVQRPFTEAGRPKQCCGIQ